MPLKTKLKDINYKDSFMPTSPTHGGNWKQHIFGKNQTKAMLKKKKKR